VACNYAIAEWVNNVEFGFWNLDGFPYSLLPIQKLTQSKNPKYVIQNPKCEYGFKVASYDKTHDLIIDPLLASTFLGGSGYDYGRGVAVDASNNVFVTGNTVDDATDLPTTTGAYDTTHNGGYDVFVSQFTNGLGTLTASTFLGGSGTDYGYGIAVDASNNVFVTGYTTDAGTDLPTTTGAYDTTHNGSDDVFVSKFGTATYIELISFTGKAGRDGTVTLTWETAAEIDNAGFNLYRARGKKGEHQKLNSFLIPATGSPQEGAVYTYTDTPDRPGVYYYQLEDIDTSGASAMHGPVRVVRRGGNK
jgi:hypothetical protein